ncbi:MAG: acyl-CoA dehydratase activase-related protein, partial [Candidatus Brocadiia bacterium]|nr:acyl-CoA dehydratase activase-related protein [Candidatus Brocadiia bacterium]
MNKVCAAGTGSFLEEQAERLGLRIEEEFGRTALSSPRPVKLGERCTVFMESDLNYHQQRGMGTEDLVAGLAYSIVYNYLNRVVEDRRIGEHIFFQGGVAFNRGVKAAFEQVTGKKVTVPPHQDVMGAIGAAILAMEEGSGESTFRGFDLRGVSYELGAFECKDCSNRCEIHKVSIEDRKALYYGSRCGKFDEEKKHKSGEHLARPFRERMDALLNAYPKDEPDEPVGVTIGIPRALTFFDLYPLWKAFFTELGCQVVLSDPTNREIIARGGDHITAESCFPIKVAYGHAANLVEKGVDHIFVPSVINMEQEGEGFVHSYLCPLVQSLPYLLRAAFEEDGPGLPLLAPIFHFERGRKDVTAGLRELARSFGASRARTDRAIDEAWKALDGFRLACRRRGEELLEGLGEDETALVIISRPYNGCDPGINLSIPDKLRDLGVLALPIDFLPLDLRDIEDEFPHMYWKYGQKIIAAARYIAGRDDLHAVYVTNFRCGPDSFITKFFDRVLGEPYLTIEIDEHSSDVGAITRCEAFLDSLRSARRRAGRGRARGEDLFYDPRERNGEIKIYVPYMDDHGVLLAAALRAGGMEAEALPMSDAESAEIGRRFTTGKECYPCILTTGDMVKKTQAPDFDPARAAFFMVQANGPCRFGQYHKFHRMVLDDLGLERVPLVVLDQEENFSEHLAVLGSDVRRVSWEMILIVDGMQKVVREIRPYEIKRGETDEVYHRCLEELAEVVTNGGDYMRKTAEVRGRLLAVPVDRSEERPMIGVVGEIYVRSHHFANNFLVRKLEQFGAQVMLPPFQEWINYIAHERREACWNDRRPLPLAREWASELVARRSERRVARIFDGAITRMPREQRTGEVLRLGSPYLDPSVKGEAVLSMARAVEYAEHGFSGVVNVVPFGCMPGAMVDSLLEKFHRRHHGIPVLKLAFDGVEQASEETVLEAFVHQARQYMEGRRTTAGKRGQRAAAGASTEP